MQAVFSLYSTASKVTEGLRATERARRQRHITAVKEQVLACNAVLLSTKD